MKLVHVGNHYDVWYVRQGAFQAEMFVYLQRIGVSKGIRQATEGRIAMAAEQIEEHLAEQRSQSPIGSVTRSYWAIHHARQPTDTPLELPNNNTFNLLRFTDDQQRHEDEQTRATS